jgi:hypothetical protein
MRNDQQRAIERTRAAIGFLGHFGAKIQWDIWDADEQRALSARDADPELGSVWGHKYPRITRVDPGGFEARVRDEVRDIATLTVFMDAATTLGAIDQRGDRFYLYDGFNDITEFVHGLRRELLVSADARLRDALRAPSGEVHRLKRGRATWLFPDMDSAAVVESSHLFLGKDPWVTTIERRSTYLGLGTDRVLVAPANAEALEGALNAWYVVTDSLETALKDARKRNREILSETRSASRALQSFVAGPDPEGRVGVTRYIPHPNFSGQCIAIGELKRFWVSANDLEPVDAAAVGAYMRGPAAAPALPPFYTSSSRPAFLPSR